MNKIAVIGAGLSGLTLANKLKDKFEVQVFEKSRSPGGRMATRRADEFSYDHGAQFFRIDQEMESLFGKMIDAGVVSCWNARFAEIEQGKIATTRIWNENDPHYVGNPSMNAVGKFLAQDLEINLQSKISSIGKEDGKWFLIDDIGKKHAGYEWVVTATPPKQAADLMPENIIFKRKLQSIKMLACYALMLGFNKQLDLTFDAAHVKNADISWISVNSSKPSRGDALSVLVNSTNKWAEENLEMQKDQVIDHLSAEFCRIAGGDISQISHKDSHRWLYANIGKKDGDGFYIDKINQIASCGDWCVQGRVEGAFKSGLKLADEMLKYQ